MADPVVVLGAGAFGTALANILAWKGHKVFLWAHNEHHVAEMIAARRNDRRLPGVKLAPAIEPAHDLRHLARTSLILAAVPAQAMRETARQAAIHVAAGTDWVICAKGLELATQSFLSDVTAEEIPQASVSALSGPSFAADIAAGLPTAVTLAHHDPVRGAVLCDLLGSATFRLYSSGDVRGVETGGAVKNVLAIACGIAHARALGASAQAALIARGFAEMVRFGTAFGALPETLMGLSGLGDLVLSCGSAQSRNYAFGMALGAPSPDNPGLTGDKLAEGAFTAQALVGLAVSRGVEMPVCAVVSDILAGKINVDQAIDSLLLRPQRAEREMKRKPWPAG